MNKILKVAEMRDLQSQVAKGEISYSRMVEIINEKHSKSLEELNKKRKKYTVSRTLKDWQMWEDCMLSFLRSHTGLRTKFNQHIDEWNTHTKLPPSAYERKINKE